RGGWPVGSAPSALSYQRGFCQRTRCPDQDRRPQRQRCPRRHGQENESLTSPSGSFHQARLPMERCFVSRNASSPSIPSSRPQPLCLTPPKGEVLTVGAPSLMPSVPASSFSPSRNIRLRSRVIA